MEIEASTSEVAKKLWNIVRIAFAMMRKGMLKSKMMMELNLLFKRGKLAGKAVAESLMVLHHHHSSASAALSCRSGDNALSFVSPRDYEFSCSNSPAAAFFPTIPKRRRHHNHNHHRHVIADSEAFAAVQKMLEAYATAEASPALPGFAVTPAAVRQLRITDSPFPIKDEGLGDSLVDVKAEDFIKKFYKNLKQQKKTAYLESPYRPVY